MFVGVLYVTGLPWIKQHFNTSYMGFDQGPQSHVQPMENPETHLQPATAAEMFFPGYGFTVIKCWCCIVQDHPTVLVQAGNVVYTQLTPVFYLAGAVTE